MKYIFIFLIPSMFICNSKVEDNVSYNGSKIDNSIGLVVSNLESDKDYIRILKTNKTEDTLSFYEKNANKIDDLNIFAHSFDYNLLVFKCISQDNNFYTVEIDKKTRELGRIKKDKYVRFETWEQHILSLFAVDFNNLTNPIYELPNLNSTVIDKDEDENYLPVTIDQDWLKVKYGNEKKPKYGWVRWKKGNMLLIELFYIA